MNIMITGATGFIGSALCERLATANRVSAAGRRPPNFLHPNIEWIQADMRDQAFMDKFLSRNRFDVVIHCAGIAHQKYGRVAPDLYREVNAEATERLARGAALVNSAVLFIFLSSVSIYGEDLPSFPLPEEWDCYPSGEYASSKLEAEERLVGLQASSILKNLIILRLAPLYDRNWNFNLRRRVALPGSFCFVRYGSGRQRLSALARINLVDFIEFTLLRHTGGMDVYNVCDEKPYEFNTIIRTLKSSGSLLHSPVITVPNFLIKAAAGSMGRFIPGRKAWFEGCYKKLTSDLVFSNERMLATGFRPLHSLETVFALN